MTSRPKKKKRFVEPGLETPSIHLKMMMQATFPALKEITEKVVMFTFPSKRRVRQNPHRPLQVKF